MNRWRWICQISTAQEAVISGLNSIALALPDNVFSKRLHHLLRAISNSQQCCILLRHDRIYFFHFLIHSCQHN